MWKKKHNVSKEKRWEGLGPLGDLPLIWHSYKKKFIQSLHLFLCFHVFHVFFLNNIKYFSFSLSFPEVKNGDRQCDGRNTQFWVCRRKVSRLFLFFCAKWEKPYTCIMHGGFFVVYLEHLHNATDKKTCKCPTWLSDTVPFKQVSLLPMITNTWKEFSTYNILISYFFDEKTVFCFTVVGKIMQHFPPNYNHWADSQLNEMHETCCNQWVSDVYIASNVPYCATSKKIIMD